MAIPVLLPQHEGPLLEVPEQSDRAGSSKHQVENDCDARIQTSQECREHEFRYRVGTSHSQNQFIFPIARSKTALRPSGTLSGSIDKASVFKSSVSTTLTTCTTISRATQMTHANQQDNGRRDTGKWQ